MSAVSCERHPVDLIVKRRRDDARRDSRTLRQWGWLHLSNGVKLVDAQEAAQLHIDFLSECTSSANGVRTKVLGNFTGHPRHCSSLRHHGSQHPGSIHDQTIYVRRCPISDGAVLEARRRREGTGKQ